MKTETIRTQLVEIIAEEAQLETVEVKETKTFDGLIDSLTLIVIVADIENNFGIKIPADYIGQLTNLESAVALVSSLIRVKPSIA